METETDKRNRESCYFRTTAQGSPVFGAENGSICHREEMSENMGPAEFDATVVDLLGQISHGTYRPSASDFAEFIVKRNKQRQKMLHGATSYLQLLREDVHSPFPVAAKGRTFEPAH